MNRIVSLTLALATLAALALSTMPAPAQMPVPHELLGRKRSTFKVPRTRPWDDENYKYFGGGPDVENECGGVGHCFHRPAVWTCPHYIVPPYPARWVIRGELMSMSREEEDEQFILFRTTDNAGLFSMSDFEFDSELAYRVSAQFNFKHNLGVEAVYLRLHEELNSEIEIDDADPLQLQAAGIVINSPVDPFDLFYQSRLQSAEANLRYVPNCCYCCSYIAGFRWLELDEIFRADVEAAPPPLQVETTNTLLGGQIGAESQHWVNYGILRIDSSIRGGVYQNNASSVSQLDPALVAANNSDIAWIGEAEVAANFPITKHAYVRVSYRLIHIAGIAVAADQINSTDLAVPVTQLDTDGDAIFHGWSVGLEAWW